MTYTGHHLTGPRHTGEISIGATATAIGDYRLSCADQSGGEAQCAAIYIGICIDIVDRKYPLSDPIGQELVRWAMARGLLIGRDGYAVTAAQLAEQRA